MIYGCPSDFSLTDLNFLMGGNSGGLPHAYGSCFLLIFMMMRRRFLLEEPSDRLEFKPVNNFGDLVYLEVEADGDVQVAYYREVVQLQMWWLLSPCDSKVESGRRILHRGILCVLLGTRM
ncbi:hypothetical protein NPIL_508151 [Nephila pilipes]|uniref:Uncharacterized protein n=1 Tax=Nephila pilipes TaxID=299642 RepID=A0A8X6PIP9_NEPPI|nr:hypothetical protein NPIL_508151 [Nephila pilipes]